MFRVYFSILFLFILSVAGFSQELITGKIIDSYTHANVSNVYIENTSRKTLCESDSTGHFSILAYKGDTLIFSSIGYLWSKSVVKDYDYHTIQMEQQVYDLQVVMINAPVSYEGFKQRIMSMKPLEDTLNLTFEFEKYIYLRNYQPGQISYALDGPITGVYNAYNKHARNAIRAMELLDNKQNILLANKKLNKEMVIDLTKIPEVYFDEFMAYCSFTDEYLATTSEYQIITLLYYKYELFLESKPMIDKL